MLLRDISFDQPEENILFDEVLWQMAEDGQSSETLRLWESKKTFVVLGRTGIVENEICAAAVKEDGIPVLRRCSGGGTVLQGKGCFNYTFILSADRCPGMKAVRPSYQIILNDVAAVLKKLNITTAFEPPSDLILKAGRKKISGNAQKRGRKYVLHHGTLLYDFDIALMEKYLKMPSRMPEYRQQRRHDEFVANISVAGERLKSVFADYFGGEGMRSDLTAEERSALKNLLKKSMCP